MSVKSKNSIPEQIEELVSLLDEKEQKLLLKELKKLLIIQKAEIIDTKVKKNNISTQEIVEICRKVRNNKKSAPPKKKGIPFSKILKSVEKAKKMQQVQFVDGW